MHNAFIEDENLIVWPTPYHERVIPLQALASWSELLGYADPADTLEAIIHTQDHGEPETDQASGENVWTLAYSLLTFREQRREATARTFEAEGRRSNPQSQIGSSAMSAFQAVHMPVDGGECTMDRCRRAARDRLGVKHPEKKCGVTTRFSVTTSDMTHQDQDILDCIELVSPCMKTVDWYRRKFLHDCAGSDVDPLERLVTDVEPDYVQQVKADFEDPLDKAFHLYGGAAQ